MEEPLRIDCFESEDGGFYQVTITDSEGKKEILHHVIPDYEKLSKMLFKGMIYSFEVELDYS